MLKKNTTHQFHRIVIDLVLCLAVFASLLFSISAHASHWRGGAMTWVSSAMDPDGIKNDVTITMKTACRVGASCQSAGSLTTPGLTKTSSTQITDQTVNGAYRLQIFEHVVKNLDLNTTYNPYYNSGARIGALLNNANGSWSIQSTILLKNGNRSPLIDMPILYQVPQKYTDGSTLVNYTKLIPALDPDGDTIKFRMANNSELGGGSSANAPGMSIDENSGLLTWTNSGNMTAGLYSAGIVVEDYDENGVLKSKTHFDIMWELKGVAELADYTGYPSDEVVVKKGDDYSFTITGTNIEVLSLGDFNGALTEPTPNTFTFTPGPVGTGLAPGIYPMTFQVIDTTGTYTDSYFTVTYIVPDPLAPELHDIHGDFSGYFSGDLVQLDVSNDATSTDIDSTHYNTGQLKITPSYKDSANEKVYINSTGDGVGQIRHDTVNGNVYFEGNLIGTVDPTKDGDGAALQINFTTDDATPVATGALMRSIYFQDNSGVSGNRKVSLYIVDDTGLSNIYAANVSAVLSDTGDALLTGDHAYHAEKDLDKNSSVDLRLGTLWDGDGGLKNILANADDNDGTDDEDGVIFPAFGNLVGSTFNLLINIQQEFDNGRQIHAWIDFDGNGVLNNTTEKIITDISAIEGDNSYPITIPNNAKLGNRYLRVRLCSSGETCDTQGGKTYDGEVEDHLIRIGDIDFGDAPDTTAVTGADDYLTLDSNGGPYQFVHPDLYIGSTAPDADQGILQDATATADNLDGTDDESGLNLIPIQNLSTDYKLYIPTTNNTGATATLIGWIDFNNNGQFEDSEGQIASVPSGVTQVNTELEWNAISPSNQPYLFIRLRLIDRVVTNITEVSSLGPDGLGEIEDHQILMNDIDLGDAPDSYGIDPSLGGAYHLIKNTTDLYLGDSTIDNDTNAQASSDALGDDISGSDDENGVTSILMPIPLGSTSYAVELNLKNMTGNPAYLVGWIDANRNGVFDAIEGKVDTISTGQDGTYTYTFNVDQLRYLIPGQSFFRFRLSTDPLSVTDSNGVASDGEVEDYNVLLGGGDFGDLPDTSSTTAVNNYQTDFVNNGPYHSIDALSSLYLGTQAPDADITSLQSINADGDNIDNINDEDGLLSKILPVLSNGAGYQANVSVTNNSGKNAYLYAWIDWDRDGNFEPDELIQQSVTQPYGVQFIPANSGTQTYALSWLNDVATVNNRTYGVRLRVTTEVLTDDTATTTIDERSLGLAPDGEVEDYYLTANNIDLGDALDSYKTLVLSDGPGHAYVSNLYLGASTIDHDVTTVPSIQSNSDDITGSDDETGIDQPIPILPLSSTSFSIDLSAYNQSGSTATLIAWLDKNQDGEFSASEVVDELHVAANNTPFLNASFSSDNYPSGSNNKTDKITLTWNNLTGLNIGNMVLRVRIANTSLTANDWFGFADGGEVEDYTVYVGNFDFGDAADSGANANSTSNYRTTLADGGPYHGLSSTLFMGASMPDGEADANNSVGAAKADGDDNTASADEDGVQLAPLDNSPVPTNYTTKVNVTNTGTQSATLYGWIDWDKNGHFDGDEATSVVVPAGTTAQDIDLTWTSFTGISAGDTVARFRLTTDTLTNSQTNQTLEDTRSFGGVSDGEVEDHSLYIGNQDLGDAPDSYQTLSSNNGPFHGLGKYSTLFLGNTSVNEGDTDGYPTADASGDDNSTTTDDEQGLVQPLALVATSATSYSVDLKYKNSTGSDATLVAWLDTNQDGQFSATEVVDTIDGNPFVINNVPNNSNFTTDANAKTLMWNGISGLTQGGMALRIRIANQPLTADDWMGGAITGEVEDYMVYIGDFDFGDAADSGANANSTSNHRTTLADGGPYHGLSSTLFMGASMPDGEADANNSVGAAKADGDDNTASADEDGVQLAPLDNSPVPTSYTTKVNVTNTGTQSATLYGWIDWDKNGHFDGDEATSVVVPAGTTAQDIDLTWTSFTGIGAGDTVARFRLTTDTLTNSQTNQTLEDTRSFGGASDGEVEDHSLYIGNQDLGDAPDSYQTLSSSNGPFHGLGKYNTLFLGNTSVNEGDTDGYPTADASGDDNSTTTDDEQGLVQPLALVAASATSYSVDLKYKNSTGSDATLVAWLDTNQDGQFSATEVVDTIDGNPFVINNVPNNSNFTTDANAKTLVWNGISGLTQGGMALRIRIANQPLTADDWMGGAITGEVEDYMVYIGDFDFGDAADSGANANSTSNYRTTLADGGPYHGLSNTLFIGIGMPDGEADANNSVGAAKADGDDNTASADEDGVQLASLDNSPVPTSYTTKVNVTNTGTQSATLYGWIDWDKNGHFDGDEATSVVVPAGTTAQNIDLTWTSFTGIGTGNTVARFRLTTDTLTNSQTNQTLEDTRSFGGASDGEVEDHSIYIGDYDFGDAPDSYQTTTASQGPAHGLINKSTLYIGTNIIDAEADGYASDNAAGDDTNGSDDENGITQILPILSTSTTSFNTTIAVRNSTTSGVDATLIAWLDTNQDGAFNANEVVDFIDYDSSGNSAFNTDNIQYNSANKDVILTWNNLSSLSRGSMALRIRLSHDQLTADDWYGVATDGEVEDYIILVGDVDYGDAPDTGANVGSDNYRTTLSDDGPRHIISSDLFMGTVATDFESGAVMPLPFAFVDDNNGNSDEDGLVYGPLSTTQTEFNATVTVTNSSSVNAYLYAWIDFDRNGRFDRDEFSANDVITIAAGSAGSTELLQWTSMSGRSNNTDVYMRVRLTHELLTDSVTGANEDPRSYGAVSSGEVEDHWVQVTNNADKGDLPDSYSTSDALGGPWHYSSTQIKIGVQATDTEKLSQATSVANGDDVNGDDEDATISDGAEGATDYSTTIAVTNNSLGPIYLNAWVDWNLNGSFEAAEHYSDTVAATATSKTLTWTGLTALTTGYYPIRIRLGDVALTSIGFVGYGGDGEVEDHLIQVLPVVSSEEASVEYDYGDAPASYGTYDVDNGAKHTLSAGLFIGATDPDVDINGQPSINADADDLTDTNDEDITLTKVLSPSMSNWDIDVIVNNNLGSAATLYGWIDYDRDGVFEAAEFTSVAVPNSGTVNLAWSGLTGGTVGQTYIRLRLTTDDLNATQPDLPATNVDERSLGGATNGEVEDISHKITFHLLIQQNAGSFEYRIEGNSSNYDVIGVFENKYGIGNVTYEQLVPTDDITTDFTLTDYQMVMYQHDRTNSTSNDSRAELDALIAYRDQGGILLTIAEGGIFTDSPERLNAYILQQMGFPGASATAFADYARGRYLPTFHPSTSAGALAQISPVDTTNSLSTVKGIDHRSILYTTPDVSGSCNDIEAMAWLIPYNPTSTGGYDFPKADVGPYIGSGERQFFFTPNYWNYNAAVYQEVANFAYDYYEDASAFNARNNWLNDPSKVNSLCSVIEVDFGDAPDVDLNTSQGNYTTANQFNGPNHLNNGDVYIGLAPTLETDAYATVAADGDMDDGVTLTPAFSGENTYSVTVNATNNTSTAANLVAWFDFNRNGQFEVSEGMTQVVPPNTIAKDYPFTFTLGGNLAANNYYARFRISTDSLTTASELGAASDGEVEDYLIVGVASGLYDGGDAPDSYMTSFASGGPYHVQTNNLFMGQKANVQYPDIESPIPSIGANSDDNNGNDDEDGLQLPPLFVGDSEYTLQALGRSVIGTGKTAKIVVWVDWDRSGTFDPNEGKIYDGIPHSGSYTHADFTWTGLNITAGDYYVRARIMPSTDAIDETMPGGYASLGEVEDHVITVLPSSLTSSGCNSETFMSHNFRDFNNDGWLINGLVSNDPYTVNSAIMRNRGFYVVADANWDVTLKRRIETRAGDIIKVNVWVGQLGSNVNDYFEIFLDNVSIGTVASTTMTGGHEAPQQVFVQGVAPSNNMELTLLMHHQLPGNNDYNVTDITVERIGAGGCTYDYGDAPDTYLTLDASVGARHVVTGTNGYISNMILGTERDAESDGIPNVAADGDDTDGTTDDEDIVVPTSIVALASTDIDYVVSGSNGFLNVWVDADIDGEFITSGEHVIQDQAVNIGSNNIATLVPYLGVTGASYLRIRVCESENNCNSPSGFAEGGEVEDHVITITAPNLDFGDAPDTGSGIGLGNYRTLFNLDPLDSGPYHSPDVDLYLGALSADSESGTAANIPASGDNATGTNDEDGIAISPLLVTNINYSVTGSVTNTTGNDAYLYVWIDWDSNGSFDKDELVDSGVITVTGNTTNQPQTLPWTTLPTLTNGDTYYLRARITSDVLDDSATGSDEDPRSLGMATNGEVEDHRIVVGDVDYGDAPDSYNTSSANQGAYHVVSTNLYLGDQVGDTEVNAVPDKLARSDDSNTSPDDEDGINILRPIPLDAIDYSTIVEVTNNTGHPATLSAWIDFNQDGAFDATETQSIVIANGTNQDQATLTWTGLGAVGLTNGMTYIRLRITTDALSDSDWAGGASDGEVEDFLLAIGLGDLGDAPDSYGTDRVNVAGEISGAMHIVEPTAVVYLGAVAPDEEADGFVDGIDNYGNATDDDVAADDEEGVTIPTIITAQPSVPVQLITRVHTDANATLHGWIDFNRNGVFDVSTESATSVSLIAADNNTDKTLSFAVPSDVLTGISYLRVRICRDSTDCSTPHGLADDGEVEDYQVNLEVEYDYGDAPENMGFKTLEANGAPRHATGSSYIYLGTVVGDADSDGFGDGSDDNGDATDDDVKGVSPSDEDAFTSIPTYSRGSGTLALTVICNDHDGSNDLGATVYGWVDFNLNSDLSDLGEFASAPCNDTNATANGTATLNFTVADDTGSGEMYVRLRITKDILAQEDINLSAGDGEIEDHAISTKDYGDAPMTYVAGGMASHYVRSNYIGSAVDVDESHYTIADGDSLAVGSGGNGDDETGSTIKLYNQIQSTGLNMTGSNIELDVTHDGYVSVWIDWNNDGDWNDSDEQSINDMAVTAGNNILPISASSAMTGTAFWTRTRYCTNSSDCNTVTGIADDGEVEDHRIALTDLSCLPLGSQFRMVTGANSYVDNSTNEIIITPDANSQRGAFWTTDKFDLASAFRVRFGIYLGSNDAGADGVTFTLQNSPLGNNAIGQLGGGLGSQGLDPAITIDFDTYYNGASYLDITNDHTAIYDPASIPFTRIGATTHDLGNIEDGQYHEVILDWDPTTNIFTYYFDGMLKETLTRDFINLDFNGDSNVYYGFTGATGGAKNLQKVCILEQTISFSEYDLGDAPDVATGFSNANYNTKKDNNGAAHLRYDFDENNQVDITLGTEWDTDDGTLQNTAATADDITNTPNDEDGVTLNTTMKPGTNENITISTTLDPGSDLTTVNVYAWIDWNRNGDWSDAGEQIVSAAAVTANTGLTYPVTVPPGASMGYTYMRVRVCSGTECNTPVGEAPNGEVEDYRIFISDLVTTATCDQLYVTKAVTDPNYTLTAVTPVQPLSFIFSNIKTGLSINGLNSLAIKRDTGILYATYRDSNQQLALIATDTLGTSFIPLGVIRSQGTYTINYINGSTSQTVNAGDTITVGGSFSWPNTGSLSRDGSEYYITHSQWDSYLVIDLAAMTFEVKPTPAVMIDTGAGALHISADWAVSETDGLIYAADISGNGFTYGFNMVEAEPTVPKLYALNPVTNTATVTNLNFNGAKAPNLWSGSVVTDDLNHLYVLTNGGDHDTNRNGSYDVFDQVGLYRINMLTNDASYVVGSGDGFLSQHDASGCIASVDRGDAPETYGKAGHRNRDVALSGTPDLILGTRWDPDIHDFFSDDATGDNVTGEDDEEGVAMPADIIVSTATVIPIMISDTTGSGGRLNIFVDLNNNGVFTDPGELVLDDYSVTNGVNNVPVTLNAAYTNGYNGDTFIRFRLCDTADVCDTATGLVDNGEVEDYQFNLINQIVLNGLVFEDNGKGGVTAHDGKQEGDERGLANFVVNAIYKGTGISGYVTNQVITSTVTGGDGNYTLVIPVELAGEPIEVQVVKQAAWVDISESDVTDPALNLVGKVINSSLTDSLMLVTATAGDYLTNIDFGKVTVPTLEPDNYTETEPGLAVLFSHKFDVDTSGDVSFSISDQQASPSGYSWNEVLYFDANCNGELDAGVDGFVTNPTAVNADTNTQVCILVKVIVPGDVPLHAVYNYQLNADLAFANTSETRRVSDVDTIKVSFSGAGELEIEKTVKNITTNGAEGRSNQAIPGDELEYKIYFINNGSGPITTIKLYDAVPEYSHLSQVIGCTSPETLLPSSIVSCSIITTDGTNAVSYEGGIEWQLGGTLAPGESGYVTYRVIVK
ncbi:L-type lectin domain-containing protein [Photobacterium kishitanii]|uniref:L-type lectin domain-containing protein n=1 Tax=Photobacterium kishitanii TaxID=318456 RepID=UPI000D16BC11|nr:L-type lectin domain-containing protein [Photobacterium kishitanii]PSU23543.1 hypothetical protein CTM84_03520 [Photobacterium kishitanii]